MEQCDSLPPVQDALKCNSCKTIKVRSSKSIEDRDSIDECLHELKKLAEDGINSKEMSTRHLSDFVYRYSARIETLLKETYAPIEYESLRDKAKDMAFTLSKIEEEAHKCAMCDGDEQNGYSSKQFLKEVCYLLHQSLGYHNTAEFNTNKQLEKMEKNKR